MNMFKDFITKHPHTFGLSIGLTLIWGGLACWLGVAHMVIISGGIITLVTIAHAVEQSN